MHNRQQFIRQFFSEIEPVNYTLLKFIDGKIEHIDNQSTLNILVDSETIPYIKSVIQNNGNVANLESVELSSMHQFIVSFQDGSFLQLDCSFKMMRKNTVYLSKFYVRQNTIVKDGVKCCNNKILFEHILLASQLNREGIPNKYFHYFDGLLGNRCGEIISAFNEKYHTGFSLKSATEFDPNFRSRLKTFLRLLPENAMAENLKNTVNYGKEAVVRFFKGEGKLNTVPGVDSGEAKRVAVEPRTLAQH